jgi:hypothetical protein
VWPNSYSVELHPGYTIEAHKRLIGAELLQQHITREYPRNTGECYYADLNEALLKAVRADVGVDRVVPAPMLINGNGEPPPDPAVVAMLLEELFGSDWEEDELPQLSPRLFADSRGIDAP